MARALRMGIYVDAISGRENATRSGVRLIAAAQTGPLRIVNLNWRCAKGLSRRRGDEAL